LVQSAREFYKRLVDILKGLGFVNNKSDPCLLSKWEDNQILLVGVYVDDCLVIGKQGQIDKLIIELGDGGFNLKVTSSLTDYLSCRVIESESRNEMKIAQPHLINSLSNKFGVEVCQLKVYKTPGTPCFKIVRPGEDSVLIDLELQKRYRSGVGMLLYLTKYTRPDLCNVVREC